MGKGEGNYDGVWMLGGVEPPTGKILLNVVAQRNPGTPAQILSKNKTEIHRFLIDVESLRPFEVSCYFWKFVIRRDHGLNIPKNTQLIFDSTAVPYIYKIHIY